MEGCRILAVRIGLRFRAFLVGEAAAVEVAVRNLLGQIDRCVIIRNADTVSRIDGRWVSDYCVGQIAGVDELAVRAHPDMNDLIVRVIDCRHGERCNGVLAYIDAGLVLLIRRKVSTPAVIHDRLDGNDDHELAAVCDSLTHFVCMIANPVFGEIKIRYAKLLCCNIEFDSCIVSSPATPSAAAVSVRAREGLCINVNIVLRRVGRQVKILRNDILHHGRGSQRIGCAASLLADGLENIRQLRTGRCDTVILGVFYFLASNRQARRIGIVGGGEVHIIVRITSRRRLRGKATDRINNNAVLLHFT